MLPVVHVAVAAVSQVWCAAETTRGYSPRCSLAPVRREIYYNWLGVCIYDMCIPYRGCILI